MADPFLSPQVLDRRKQAAAIATGVVVGAALAAALGAFLARVGDVLLVGSVAALGAIVGGVLGGAIASRVDMGPWEPRSARRGYVGTHAPDDADRL